MSYRFKGQKVIINGEKQYITPGPLPSSPENGNLAIDSSDNLLKVYNASKARWVVLGDAEDVFFDNSANGFVADDVQAAIEEVQDNIKKNYFAQFQLIGSLNYSEYLYSSVDAPSNDRSGDSSNGYEFSNSAPLIAPFSGKIKKGVFAIKGVAVSTGSAASTVTVNFELWKVGFNGEGTKLGDIDVDIDSSSNTIGNWWNSSIDTDFTGSNTYNVSVSEGDLLGLKFIRVQNNSNAVEIKNATVSLHLEED